MDAIGLAAAGEFLIEGAVCIIREQNWQLFVIRIYSDSYITDSEMFRAARDIQRGEQVVYNLTEDTPDLVALGPATAESF